ncbi:MAG: hypothetical protein WDN24_16760 [Sphingomonas sp.]
MRYQPPSVERRWSIVVQSGVCSEPSGCATHAGALPPGGPRRITMAMSEPASVSGRPGSTISLATLALPSL